MTEHTITECLLFPDIFDRPDKALEEAVDGGGAEWTSDGRYFLFVRQGEMFAMPLFGDRKPFRVLENLRGVSGGTVSPDGKWLAYVTRNSGESAVDVAPFPRGNGAWQVSTNGGSDPRWRRDSKELFYIAPDNQIMAAEVVAQGSTFTVAKVSPLFHANSAVYDVSPDGKKFLVVSPSEQKTTEPLTLVVNWPALLKK